MPFRGDIRVGTRAGLRRRLAGAARPVRPAPARRRARARHDSAAATASPTSPLLVGHAAARRRRRRGPRRPRRRDARRPGERLHSARHGAASSTRSPRGVGPASTRATSARGSLSAAAPASTTPTTSSTPMADWVDPLGLDVLGHDVWTIPPNSQGYLALAGRVRSPNGTRPPRRPGDAAWAHLLVEAARQAGVRPRRGAPRGRRRRRAARRRPTRGTPRRSSTPTGRPRWPAPAASRRHDLPLRRRRRRHGRLAHPVERRRLRLRTSSSRRHRHLPPQPRASASPWCRVTPPSTAPGVDRPRRCRRRSSPDRTAPCAPSWARWAATPSPRWCCSCWSASCTTPGRPVRRCSAPRFVLANHASAIGFSTWNDPAALGVDVEADVPDAWIDGLRSRGHDVRVRGSLRARFRTRPRDHGRRRHRSAVWPTPGRLPKPPSATDADRRSRTNWVDRRPACRTPESAAKCA